jgi:hypothetical protein
MAIVTAWLTSTHIDPSPYEEFDLYEISETVSPSEPCRDYLAQSILSARLDPGFLSSLARELGWDHVEELVGRAVPRDPRAKAGDFGEILAAALLEEFHGYQIPINKLRFKLTRGQMLPATDIFALKTTADGSISEVCYSESKLRASPDLGAGTDGYAQLYETVNSQIPEILQFVLARLYENGNPMFQRLAQFLKDRRDLSGSTTHRLFLCYDLGHWDDRVLSNVEDSAPKLSSFTIHKLVISDLISLVEDVYSRIANREGQSE